MTRTLKSYGGEDLDPVVDLSEECVWDEAEFSTRSYVGEASSSLIPIRDTEGNISASGATYNIGTRNVIEVAIDAQRIWRGRRSPMTSNRWIEKSDRARRHDITAEDYNIDLRGIIVDGWSRPEETDYVRVQALAAQFLNGSPRATTVLDASTYVPNTNTLVLPAHIYSRTDPFGVLTEIGGQTAKNFFVTIDDELFYDRFESTAYPTTISISDRPADTGAGGLDGSDPLCYAPQWISGPPIEFSGISWMSGARMFWGPNADQYVEEHDAARAALNAYWAVILDDESSSNEIEAQRRLSAILDRGYQGLTYNVTIGPMTDAHAKLLKPGQLIDIKARVIGAANDFISRRIASLTWTTPLEGVWFATMILDTPHRAIGKGRPAGPHAPTQPTPGTCTRLYPSNHLSGNPDTAECDAAPNLLQADIAANWDFTGGALDYYYMYDTPQSSATGTGQFATWAATDAAAGEAAISGWVHILDGPLLASIQAGGTFRAQFRMRSRYGVGISESAQNNLAAEAVRVYRPGTGFVATLANVGTHAGAPKFVAQSTPANRSFQATLAAYASAVSGDYLVVDIGTTHIGPITGGTGASVFINDTAASDLPEDEVESTNLRSWVEVCSGATAGDTTEPVAGPGTADPGDSDTYAPLDHVHEHGYLADDGVHMHDADQVAYDGTSSGLTASDVQSAIDEIAVGVGGGWYFPETYGALGDGSTDDAVALQDCFDDAASVHGLVKLGAKEYVCSAKLDIDIGPITILGDGAEFGQGAAGYGTSRIRFTNSNAHHIDVAAAGNGSIFRGFRIDGPGGTQSAGAGIYSLKYISVDHVIVDGCYDGIRLGAESYYSELHHVMCYDQDNIGIRIENGANNANLFNPRVHTAATGISIEGNEKVAITGGTVEQCTTGILVNAGANTTGGVTIAGMYFEQAAGANTDIAIGRVGTPQGVIVSGNKFTQHNTGGYHIDAERVDGLSIIGNDFRSTATTVRIQSSITGKAIFMGNRNAGAYSIATDKGLIVDTLGDPAAADVSIADAGAYYTGADVEAALQEIGADLVGGVGGAELLIADSHSTPLVFADIVQNDTQDDFMYEG